MQLRIVAVVGLLCGGMWSGCTCNRQVDDGSSSSSSGSGGAASGSSGQASGGASSNGGSNASGNGGGSSGTNTSSGGTGCVPGLTAITVTPSGMTLPAAIPPSPITFTATGTVNGAMVNVGAQVQWSVERDDDSPTGTVSSGVFQPPPGVGGLFRILARDTCANATGTATVTLNLEATFAPPDAATLARFGGTVVTTQPASAPQWVYPSDQTRFPRNLYKTLFQWRTNGSDFYRLTFAGPAATITVFTNGQHVDCATANPAAGCLEPTFEAWQAIAGSNAGSPVTITLDGVKTGDTNVYRAAPLTIAFSRRDVRGAIFYWSTTVAGVRRANISDAAPEPYVVGKPTGTMLTPGGEVSCVACHTVSRSGRKMVAGTKADTNGLYVYDVTSTAPPTPTITNQIVDREKNFGTFSPDDTRLVATRNNRLVEYDLMGQAVLATLPTPGDATHPDWSPDGQRLVYATGRGDAPGNANLRMMHRQADGGWGDDALLAASSGQSNLFPSHAPDGTYVAYSRGEGGHGDRTAQLFVVRTDGTGTPLELLNANRMVNSATTDGQFENNMPTWAPRGDLDWIAFNTFRPYGVVKPTGGTQQIWVAAVDWSRLADGGMDPSWPAFRLGFQQLNENNHRAFWTEDVRYPDGGPPPVVDAGQPAPDAGNPVPDAGNPPPDGGMCALLGQLCDQAGAGCCDPSQFCDVMPDDSYRCQTFGG